jgi:hypothetical protein
MAKHEGLERSKSDRFGKKPSNTKPTPDLEAPHYVRAPSASDAPAWNFSAIPVSRASGSLQPKLEVGAVNDPLEREADRIADRVTRMPDSSRAESKAPTKASSSAGLSHAEAPSTVHEALRSTSRPLDPDVRAFMEPRFGHDFSQVRLHSGTAAAESARTLNAHAYTVGDDIVFGSGKLAPATKDGSRLLAHELTHVVQQGQGVQLIQRDESSGGDPVATGEEIEKALVNYLHGAWDAQGGRSLKVDRDVQTAVSKLAGTFTAVDSKDLLRLSIEEFAKNAGKVLGGDIPRSQMMHLYKIPEKKRVPSKSWVEKKKDAAKEALGKVGKTPEDVRAPNESAYPPGGKPDMGGDSPGQHSVPPQAIDPIGERIDKATGGSIKKNPPPSKPQGTPAGNQDSDTADVPAPIGISPRRFEDPTGPFLRSPVSSPPTLDLGESLAESASPLVAASIGSVTIDGFVTGKADIPGGKVESLSSTAKIIVVLLKRYPASTIRITGHTDGVGKEDDNQRLGQRRADSAQAFLVTHGIPSEAIRTQSAGATQLLVNTKNAEPKNRRVEILFETSTLLRDFGRSSNAPPPNLYPRPKTETMK